MVMSGRAEPAQQPRRTRNEGARADGKQQRDINCALPKPGQDAFVTLQCPRPPSARYDENVGNWRLVQREVWNDLETTPSDRPRDHADRRDRERCRMSQFARNVEHLVGPA